MDFGSARPAHVSVTNRREALMVQEDAAARSPPPRGAPLPRGRQPRG